MADSILIIDSNTNELRRLREVLSREGYNVMTAVDQRTALQICQQVPVKFILGETDLIGYGTTE